MKRSTWVVIISSAAILCIVMGLRQSFGLFLKPITTDLGIGREIYALALALTNLLWGLGSPFAGAIADKYGPSRVALLGGLFYAAGLLVMALSQSGEQLVFSGVLLGMGLSGAAFSVVLGAAGRAAPAQHRSQALGVVSLGGSIGQFMFVPYAHTLLAGYDWVIALMVMSATSLLVLPFAWGLRGLSGTTQVEQSEQSLKEALAEAIRHRGFLFLTAGFFVCGFHLAFVGVHFPAFLEDQGFPTWLGATALILIGLFNMIGTYFAGLLGGKFLKKNVLSLIYLGRALLFLMFLVLPITFETVIAFSIGIGLLWLGTVPLTSGLVAVIFGPIYMSMLYGIVFFSHQLGWFGGAWLAGYLFDAIGSYEVMWLINIGLGVMSAVLHWPIAERPVARLKQTESAST